jgi:hypothetical protein
MEVHLILPKERDGGGRLASIEMRTTTTLCAERIGV